jgi:acetyl-CoA acyltransferase
MKEAVIVAYGRSPIGKAAKGSLAYTRPEAIASQVIKGIMERNPKINPVDIEDSIVGCSIPEAEQGMNIGRMVALKSGLPTSACGQTINRFCASGLQTIATAANAIMADQADCILAGGVESMSFVPMATNAALPDPDMIDAYPEAFAVMGITAENVAKEYHVSREDMDRFAMESHKKAAAAIAAGKFVSEIIPVKAIKPLTDEKGRPALGEFDFTMDEALRPHISMDALAKLPPAFKLGGSVTAGNSSQMSDGAAFVILMSREKAEECGIRPIALFRGFALAGVKPELMGIGPIPAIPKALKRTGISLAEIDLIELNEAFASQALAVIREVKLDPEKVNVNGGAIAFGHPLGCTGAYLTIKLLEEMKRRSSRLGMVTMCIGSGMGAAGVFELL